MVKKVGFCLFDCPSHWIEVTLVTKDGLTYEHEKYKYELDESGESRLNGKGRASYKGQEKASLADFDFYNFYVEIEEYWAALKSKLKFP